MATTLIAFNQSSVSLLEHMKMPLFTYYGVKSLYDNQVEYLTIQIVVFLSEGK